MQSAISFFMASLVPNRSTMADHNCNISSELYYNEGTTEDILSASMFGIALVAGVVHTVLVVSRTRTTMGDLFACPWIVARTGPWLTSVLMTLSFFVRMCWYLARCTTALETSNQPGWRFLSRLAIMLELTAFSVVLYAWVVVQSDLRLRSVLKVRVRVEV